MKTFLLLFGVFWIGFFVIELIAAIGKRPMPLLANMLLGTAFVCVGAYFVW